MGQSSGEGVADNLLAGSAGGGRRCLTTGRPLPPRSNRTGPPSSYFNADARNLPAYLGAFRGALERLANEPGFTRTALRSWRQQLFEVLNVGPLRPPAEKTARPKRQVVRLMRDAAADLDAAASALEAAGADAVAVTRLRERADACRELAAARRR